MAGLIRQLAPLICCFFLLYPVQSQGQSVKKELTDRLNSSGVSDADTVVRNTERQLGTSLDISMHDRVDFSDFPDARLNVNRLKAPAVLLLSEQTVNYVFQGKPKSFQGSFRSYEFHLGKGLQKAAHLIFPQVFERIRATGDSRNVGEGEVTIVPTLDAFQFRWGGAFTPVMYVTLKTSVILHVNGAHIFKKSYEVKDVKQGTGNLFPNEDQEYKAISRALLLALKKSADDISRLPVLVAYDQKKEGTVFQVKTEKIDMAAILFLADTWKKYHENKSRLTPTEQRIAARLLRLKVAQDNKNTAIQQKQLLALIEEAKKLEPVSRAELIDELKFYKGYTDIQVTEQNKAEDRFFNFAGNYTGDVLDYAGLGIDLAKVAVLAAGCLADPFVTCTALATTMSGFDTAGSVAEGLGVAIEEVAYKSGDVKTALFQGAKASLIDFSVGKLTGDLSEAAVEKMAHKTSAKLAESWSKEAIPGMVEKVRDTIYVNSMEIFYRAPSALAGSVSKDVAKRIEATAEEITFNQSAAEKTLSNESKKGSDGESLTINFNSLKEL